MSSGQLAENGDIHCWYAEMQQWFESHAMSINALPPFQYSLDCPHLNMTKVEKNREIQIGVFILIHKYGLFIPDEYDSAESATIRIGFGPIDFRLIQLVVSRLLADSHQIGPRSIDRLPF